MPLTIGLAGRVLALAVAACAAPVAGPAGLLIRYEADGRLASGSQSMLDCVAAAMRADASITLVLRVHTDTLSSREYALGMSDVHARPIVERLVAGGVEPERVSIVAVGEEEALCEDAACQHLNRQIELVPGGGPESLGACLPE